MYLKSIFRNIDKNQTLRRACLGDTLRILTMKTKEYTSRLFFFYAASMM